MTLDIALVQSHDTYLIFNIASGVELQVSLL